MNPNAKIVSTISDSVFMIPGFSVLGPKLGMASEITAPTTENINETSMASQSELMSWAPAYGATEDAMLQESV